jgi:cyclopropane-fatty-acyl-phospholipid synthase
MTQTTTQMKSLIVRESKDLTIAQKLARRGLLRAFNQTRYGRLTIADGEHTFSFEGAEPGPEAHVTILNPQVWTDVAFRGSVGSGEAYMAGFWVTRSLDQVTRFFVANNHLTDQMERGFTRFFSYLLKTAHWFNKNTLTGSKKNIEAHYDLGNSLFETFLDPTLMYSSALFSNQSETLHQASVEKLDHICRKLHLSESDHVLEIGTGWGGFAVHAAENYGCRVTTTTISEEQYDHAIQLVRQRGLTDQVTVLKQDYRDLKGEYDKLVSIEMIEAVGHHYLDTYVNTLSNRLKPDGLALIQAITIVEQRYQLAVKSVDFIKRYIFPGGFIPSIGSIMQSVGNASDLRLLHLEDFASHYARTLAEWRKRFNDEKERILQLGYDERFCRMWEFYLAYCEGGFHERQLGLAQLILAKPKARQETPVVELRLA